MGTPRSAEPQPSELNTSGTLTFMEVGKDKLTVRYNGPAQHESDVGSIQANHPVPRRCLVYYFEVSVKEASGGSITLGFSDRNFKQGRHPGYEPHSFGYRGDTGRKHQSSLPVRGEEYGPTYGAGDVIGVGIHLPKQEIFFTKNGSHLGTAFRNVTGHPLFPTIGLHSQSASVEVNFGRQPFRFDVAALVAAEQRQLAQALDSTTVSAGVAHHLVRNYLLHYGYQQSLEAFDAAAGMEAERGVEQAAADADADAEMEEQAGGEQQHQQHQQQQRHEGQQQEEQAPGPQQGCRAGEGAANGQATSHQLLLLPLRAQLRQLLMAGDTAAARQLLEEQAPELLASPTLPALAATHGRPSGGGGGGATAGHAAEGTDAAGPAEALADAGSAGISGGATASGSGANANAYAAAASGSGRGESGGAAAGGSFELQFCLACQQYIELIRRGDVPGALRYAEATLCALRGASPEHDEQLKNVVALIAYQQPEQSPLAELLSPARREAAADIVNQAVLKWQAPAGSPEPQAALEVALQQLTAVQCELHELNGGHGPDFDLQEHLPQPAQPRQSSSQRRTASQQGQQGQEVLQQQQGQQDGEADSGAAAAGASQEPEPMAEG